MSEIMTPAAAAEILSRLLETAKASIFEGATQKPFEVQSETIDLSTAKPDSDPKRIGFPFRSIYVADASDVYATLNMRPNSRDTIQSAIPFKKNDSWSKDLPIAEAYLSWPAQPGKWITILYFVSSEFKSGSQISVTGGGVSLVDGSAVTGPTQVVLPPATATIVAPVSSTRKKASIQNKTGASIYIGGSTVTATGTTEGIEIPNGAIISWQNTGALYAYSVAGGNVARIDEA